MTTSVTISDAPCATPTSSPEMSRGARVLVRAVEGYRRLRAGRVSACRFYPSCSEYAAEAITTHGAWRGGGLALRRLLRCRPLGPHGVDLVPDRRRS